MTHKNRNRRHSELVAAGSVYPYTAVWSAHSTHAARVQEYPCEWAPLGQARCCSDVTNTHGRAASSHSLLTHKDIMRFPQVPHFVSYISTVHEQKHIIMSIQQTTRTRHLTIWELCRKLHKQLFASLPSINIYIVGRIRLKYPHEKSSEIIF